MPEFFRLRADILQTIGRDQEALNSAQRSLNLLPNFPTARLLQIALLANLGHDSAARESWQNYLNSSGLKQFKTVADYQSYYAGR